MSEDGLPLHFSNLFTSGAGLACVVPRECLMELGVGITGCVGRQVRENLYDPLEMGTEKMVRLQLVICYRTGDKTTGLDLEERKDW